MKLPTKLANRIERLRHKLAHNGRGLATTERRIRHYRHRRDANPGTRTGRRAARLLRRWQRRQTYLVGVHRYLQLLLDKDLKRKHDWLKSHPDPKPQPSAGNFVTFDGHQVPRWIGEILSRTRANGTWHGTVISGYRSPEYSTSLCMAICGQPSCSGTCAGANSNHSCPPTHTGIPYEGAVDATDAGNLRANSGGLLNNHLPSDYPHSSHGGY